MQSTLSNKSIARLFRELAQLMEFHGENAFKIRSYSRAYDTFRALSSDLSEMTAEEISAIPQVGKAITEKVLEIRDRGSFGTLDRYREDTPEGIRQLLSIRGLGVKKIQTIVQELQVTTPGELLYACLENRLIEVKGFGAKSQANIRQALEYWQAAQGKLILPDAWKIHEQIMELADRQEVELVLVGDLCRWMPVVESLEYLTTDAHGLEAVDSLHLVRETEEGKVYELDGEIQFLVVVVEESVLRREIFERSGSGDFVDAMQSEYPQADWSEEAEDVFESLGMPYISPECRESDALDRFHVETIENLVTTESIHGAVHNHSTWSDGNASILDMAKACMDRGYSYFGISDHSQTAFYANGLKPDRVRMQWDEIDKLNALWREDEFRVFKGIESDILHDGSLDYDEDILQGFDFVVASIHSNLKMDIAKATDRLLTAIENPYTRILGHPTGRLLLSREGYPIDHRRIIDACADQNVVLELNANPLRLDLDWTWIEYAMSRGVMISINPDAHSIQGLDDMRYGVMVARKGLLGIDHCLNAMSMEEFAAWCSSR